mmetsp:Transcript_64433/g.119845  ORF Transcript_64433/g.119845 Transcript_64433/m.119845 type:complete len:301 (+) Transcript_64433:85-987(+)
MPPPPTGAAAQPARGDAKSALEQHVSVRLLCPLSGCIMEEPVLTPCGNTYDRPQILARLQREAVDPQSGEWLDASMLYPNRSLRDELIRQLERLASQGESSPHLAGLATRKLQRVQSNCGEFLSSTRSPSKPSTGLEDMVQQCAVAALWSGQLAWEQVLTFTTSFGGILALAVDIRNSLKKASVRPPPLLHNFLQLTLRPGRTLPPQWRWRERAAVWLLRVFVLLPISIVPLTIAAGCCLSSVSFLRCCYDRWKHEPVTHSMAFRSTLRCLACATVAGSIGLYARLYADRRWPSAAQIGL